MELLSAWGGIVQSLLPGLQLVVALIVAGKVALGFLVWLRQVR